MSVTPEQFNKMSALAFNQPVTNNPSMQTLNGIKNALWFAQNKSTLQGDPLFKVAEEELKKLRLGAQLIQDDRIRQSLGGGKGLDTAMAAGTVALQKYREKTLEELIAAKTKQNEALLNAGIGTNEFSTARARLERRFVVPNVGAAATGSAATGFPAGFNPQNPFG